MAFYKNWIYLQLTNKHYSLPQAPASLFDALKGKILGAEHEAIRELKDFQI